MDTFTDLVCDVTGYRSVHKERVRQEVQPHVALHRGAQLRFLRDARDPPLHLLLPRPSGYSPVQERLGGGHMPPSKFYVVSTDAVISGWLAPVLYLRSERRVCA